MVDGRSEGKFCASEKRAEKRKGKREKKEFKFRVIRDGRSETARGKSCCLIRWQLFALTSPNE
jgi:hypothetical protein